MPLSNMLLVEHHAVGTEGYPACLAEVGDFSVMTNFLALIVASFLGASGPLQVSHLDNFLLA